VTHKEIKYGEKRMREKDRQKEREGGDEKECVIEK